MVPRLRRALLALGLIFLVGVSPTLAQVALTEFLASNARGITDEDGDHSDWIEVQNTGTTAVNLKGWSLTDDPTLPAKWVFPSMNLNGGASVVVFASGKNRTAVGSPLHTSFQLSAEGEYLGLFAPDATTATTEFAPAYPPQRVDISYGFRAGQAYYFTSPTPGTENTGGVANFVADTKFDHHRGFFDAAFDLTITCATPGATIRYTTNGASPSVSTGLVYSAPVTIRGTTVLRAAAFKDGLQPSNVDTQTYLFLDDVLQQSPTGKAPPGWPTSWGGNVVDYGMDPEVVTNALYKNEIKADLRSIPTFSLVTELKNLFDPGTGIYANASQDTIAWERPCSLELIQTNGSTAFQVNGGVRIRGGYSRSGSNPKHAFRFFFRDIYGASRLKYPVFGPTGVSSMDQFDLRTFENYSWSFEGDSRGVFIRDVFSRDAQLAMNQPGSRGNYFHLFINGQYWGLYNTDERPEASFGAGYLGGNKADYDVIKVAPDNSYTIYATDGDMQAWTRLYNAAKAGLASDAAYMKVQGLNPDGTPNPAYENLIDVDNLIDYMLVIFYGGNLDAPISNFLGNTSPNNFFGFRDRTGAHGGFRFVCHDSEHTLLSVTENRVGPYSSGASSITKSNPQYIFQQMWGNAEFRIRMADRVQKQCFNGGPLSPEGATALLRQRTNEIFGAVVAESARWGDSKRTAPLTRNKEWVTELTRIFNSFIPQRTGILITQLKAKNLYPSVAAPTLTPFGGTVDAGSSATLAAPSGDLYYTVDGTDPRLQGGALAPAARQATGPIAINESQRLRARVLNAGNWSALVEADFTLRQTFRDLFITEILYHGIASGTDAGSDLEFIELKNVGSQTLDVSGVHFADGIDFTFAKGRHLAPGEFAVLVANPGAFATRYPGVHIEGTYLGSLSKSGEHLALVHADGSPIFEVTYGTRDRWPTSPDGGGFSLVPVLPNANPDPATPSNWRASSAVGGSPGADDPVADVPVVIINEVIPRGSGPLPAVIELFNPGTVAAGVGGWYVSPSRTAPLGFRIPAGRVVPPQGYLAIPLDSLDAAVPGTRLGYDGRGGELWIHSANASGTATGYSDGLSFSGLVSGDSLGRVTNSVGKVHWLLQSRATLGAVNAAPALGPVLITEIQYHPATSEVEFVEVRNISSDAVTLFDPVHPANTWSLEGAGFDFPTGVTLPRNGFAVITAGDPAAFRIRFSIPAATPVFGPMSGTLQDNGERLTLERPLAPETVTKTDGTTEAIVPRAVVDSVAYDSIDPWPIAAAGSGPSLERRSTDGLSDDPASWIASKGKGSPGVEGSANTAPRVDAGADQAIESLAFPVTATLKAAAVDDGLPGGPLVYLWTQVDGPAPVSFSNSASVSPVVQLPGQGSYTLRLTVSDGKLSASDDVVLSATRPAGDAVLLPAGSVWRYLDDGKDGGVAWRAPEFNDSSWKSGKAQLGYSPDEGDEATLISYGPDANNKFISYYFRTRFVLSDARSVTALSAQLLRDDGAVVFLNGQEVWRDNMPVGDYTYLTFASSTVGGADESTFFSRDLDATLLRTGTNTLAVEVHQSAVTSSDISFDFSLTAKVIATNQAPTVDAGPDQSIALPAAAALQGAFRDDGLPSPPSAPSFAWSKVSGPGSVTFSTGNRLASGATFTDAGRYVLRLTVSDGALSASDDLIVDVATGEVPPAIVFHGGGSPALGFTTEVGRSYTVQAREDLVSGSWTVVQQVPAGASVQSVQVPLNGSGTMRYFRVISPAVP